MLENVVKKMSHLDKDSFLNQENLYQEFAVNIKKV